MTANWEHSPHDTIGRGRATTVAHPGRSDSVGALSPEDLDRMLAEIPIDGLEAHYRSHTDEQTALYRRLADEKGLLISTGSDSHAPHQPVNPRPWRAVWAKDLLHRLGITVDSVSGGSPVWEPGMDPLAPKPQPAENEPEQPEAPTEEPRTDAAVSAAMV